MRNPISLPIGEHEVVGLAIDWEIALIGPYPEDVQLTASIQFHPNRPLPRFRDKTATTLVIRMDSQAASVLLEKLSTAGRSMGWPPKEEDGNQA
jgi:hypothetical protein